MSDSNLITLPTRGQRERAKAAAEKRYRPMALDLGEDFGTYYFRRLSGPELDELSRIQTKNPQMSVAEYNSRVTAMALCGEPEDLMTWEEILQLGPKFYTVAADYAMKKTTDYTLKTEEAEGKTDEPAPFLSMPGFAEPSATNGVSPSSKSTKSLTSTPT